MKQTSHIARTLAAVAALAFLTVGVGPTSTAIAEEQMTVLAGTNHIEADGSSRARIAIPRDVALSTQPDHISIATDGRFAALILVEQTRSGGAVYMAGRYDQALFCDAECPGMAGLDYVGHVVRPLDSGELPAGLYDLYVVADDAQVTITLHVDGLTGVSEVPLAPHADVAIDVPGNRSPLGRDGHFYAGSSDTLHGTGLLYRLVGASGTISGPANMGDCLYAGDEPPLFAYAPGCPLAQDAGRVETLFLGNNGWTTTLSALLVNADSGSYGQGGNFAMVGSVDKAAVLSVWLTY